MTLTQYAIARVYRQLELAKETRVLREREWCLIELLRPVVERFEATEMRGKRYTVANSREQTS
jgi:hypothetical protein